MKNKKIFYWKRRFLNDKKMYFCSMLKNKFLILVGVICLMAFVSCSKHSQILKSTDNEYKYNSAMYYYGQKDYNRALQLFDVLQSAYRGKPQGEEIALHCGVLLQYERL